MQSSTPATSTISQLYFKLPLAMDLSSLEANFLSHPSFTLIYPIKLAGGHVHGRVLNEVQPKYYWKATQT